MAIPPGPSVPRSATMTSPQESLRYWGILVLVFFVLTSLVGGSLALESSYLAVTLASHIGLGIVTLVLAGYATSAIGRRYRTAPRTGAALSAVSALFAVIAGTVYLTAGQPLGALSAMEVFAGTGIVGALLMIVFGGPSGLRSEPRPVA